MATAQRYSTFYIIEIVKYNKTDFYSILIYILRQLPGYIFVIISVIRGILAVVIGGPPHPHCIVAEELGDPSGPPPPSSVIYCALIVIVYIICSGGGVGKEQIEPPPPPRSYSYYPSSSHGVTPKGYEDPRQICPRKSAINPIVEELNQDINGLLPLGIEVMQVAGHIGPGEE